MNLKGVAPNHLETVCSILGEHLPGYEVWAFGSRANGSAVREFSDLDLAVMTEVPLDTLVLADLKEAFTESDLPFKVDVIDWATTSERFQAIVRKRYQVIQQSRPPAPPIPLS